MPTLIEKVEKYVSENISDFHNSKLEGLKKLKLAKILSRKNPYLYKAKNMLTAEEIVKGIVDAHLSSNEETIFGDWLEKLAIFIAKSEFGGQKSSTNGVDLQIEKGGTTYLVSIKSGPNWGNSSQIKKMIADFNLAKKTLKTSGNKIHVEAVNGCCYGKDDVPEKGQYIKLCGQRFWTFISEDPNLYTSIIEPLGYEAVERNSDFLAEYAKVINKFVEEFLLKFMNADGAIDWQKIVKFNSEAKV